MDRIEGLFGSIETELNQAADDKKCTDFKAARGNRSKISTSVLMIERRECSLIRAAEAKGKVIDFRPTTSPQAVLGVRLDRQPDQDASAFNSPISWKSIGCRRRRRGYSSGFCRMMTLVPMGTRS